MLWAKVGYDNAYVGKLHLAGYRESYSAPPAIDYEAAPIPPERPWLPF